MEFNLILNLIIWIALWSLGWAGFFILNKKGIDLIKRHHLTSLYFLTISILIITIYKKEFVQYVNIKFNILPIISLASLFLLNYLAYKHIKNNFKKPTKLIKEHPDMPFLELDNKYLTSKSFEILFQQILIVLLITWLDKIGFSTPKIIISFAVLFGLGHVYLIFKKDKFFGIFFTFFSTISGAVFPLLIIYLPFGFIYSYIVHWLFYILAGYLFWKIKF